MGPGRGRLDQPRRATIDGRRGTLDAHRFCVPAHRHIRRCAPIYWRHLSDQASAQLEAPPPLRAVALVKSHPTRAAMIRRSELASKRFDTANDLLMLMRERRAQLVAMDHYNGLAQLRVPNSIYEPDAEEITPDQRWKEQQRRRLKKRVIYADRHRGWTAKGVALFRRRFRSSWRIFLGLCQALSRRRRVFWYRLARRRSDRLQDCQGDLAYSETQ